MGLVAKAQQMHGVIAMDRLVMVGIGAELARADGKAIGLVFALKHFVACAIAEVAMPCLCGVFMDEQAVGPQPCRQQQAR